MGFRSGFVISSVSFLFGTLFIASIYDFPLLYSGGLEPSAIEAADRFYLSMYNGPTAVTALLHGMIGLGLIGLIAKLHRWSEMAKYFDGGSLVLLMGAVCIAPPNAPPTSRATSPPPPPDGPLTADERIATIRIIAATNTICIALLLGVLVLQTSEWYLDSQDRKQQERNRANLSAQLASPSNPSESKKQV